jgi:hypothetical protein
VWQPPHHLVWSDHFPYAIVTMAARTFTDSAGLTWDVFEVHRASRTAGAVSPGLENGWLAFASGENKRRLAPFPPAWETYTDAELEALCDAARRAPTPRFPLDRPVRPRIKRSMLDEEVESSGSMTGTHTTVESTIRDFAHDARARGLPAVAAMLELKALLQERHPEPDSDARDRQLVRRWFVQAFYFERDVGASQDA